MEINFLIAHMEAGPTQFEQCASLVNEMVVICSNAKFAGTRPVEAVTAAGIVFFQMCDEAGYDKICVMETLNAMDSVK